MNKRPDSNIAEIALIGTGGGYGEAVVIHLGNDKWVVVDSCIDPKSGKSLPLAYLENLGVDVENSVELIVCTHWHDDHIQGISQLFEQCKTAKFAFARPTDTKKFLYLVGLDGMKDSAKISACSTREFKKCIDIRQQRGRPSIEITADRVLLGKSGMNASVYSLSPSDNVLANYDLEISRLITQFGKQSKRIQINSPNEKSVALYIDFGKHKVILGSDLEIGKSEFDGWFDILNHSQVVDKTDRASLFKIPHHGSANGYTDGIWSDLVGLNAVAKLTPWNRNKKLPTPEMLELYLTKTNLLYMTKEIPASGAKRRNRAVDKIIDRLGLKIMEVKYAYGVIRSRIDIADPSASWNVELFGEAFHVNSSPS